jgi:hypothetical protein
MDKEEGGMDKKPGSEFEKASRSNARVGILGEFWWFLWSTGKWWLMPILILLLVFGGFMLLSGTAVAPFLYTIF